MKNWFVGVQQKTKKSGDSVRTKKRDAKNLEAGIVKQKTKKKSSLKSCVDYLLSKKHENHIHTEIYEIGNARHDLNNILDEVDSVRLKNAATSFCASLPADLYHPSLDEWENIYNLTIENYCDSLNKELEKLEKAHHKKSIPSDERREKEYHLNTERYSQRLDIDEMKRLSICVIHDDRNKPLIIGETSGSQMNLLISNVIGDKVVKLISQKAGVELFKKSYVNAVKSELGLDPKKYLTYEERPEGSEHCNFYEGDTNVELLELEASTPRKKRKDQNLRIKDDKKSFYKAINEKLESVVVRETEADQKLEQVPRAQKIIKTANVAIRAKKKAVADVEYLKLEKNKLDLEVEKRQEIIDLQDLAIDEQNLDIEANNETISDQKSFIKRLTDSVKSRKDDVINYFNNLYLFSEKNNIEAKNDAVDFHNDVDEQDKEMSEMLNKSIDKELSKDKRQEYSETKSNRSRNRI